LAQEAGGAAEVFDQKTGRPIGKCHGSKLANSGGGDEISSVVAGRGVGGT
jgi:hypothetical protein